MIPVGYDPARLGCTAAGCQTQDTRTLCGRFGRRCESHSPWRSLADAGLDGPAYRTWRQYSAGRAS
jgi:hypothetical protein